MAGKIKGITVELNGNASGMTKALREINSESKSTQSELKQVDKALKFDPSNTVLLKQKQELLTKAVSESKTALEALKDSKAQADKAMSEGTEVNQKQYRQLQREIVEAESKVKSLEKQHKEFGSVAVQQIKNVGDEFGKVGEKLTSVGTKMTTVSAGIVAAGGALAIKAATSADDINTLSKQTGLATDEIQKYQYAAERIDVPLETLTGSMSKLTKNMLTASSGTGDAYDSFQKLGVEFQNQDGTLKDRQEVFNNLITALSGMTNETERDAAAMTLFGKSAQDLNPLILGGADALTKYGEEAEAAGLILSQDVLDKANETADSVDKLKATVSAASKKVGSDLSTIVKPAAEKATNTVEKLTKQFSELTEEQKKTILKITAVVVAIGPLLVILGKLFTAIKIVSTAIAFLATNPVTIAITAIGVLAAGIGLAVKAANEDSDAIKELKKQHEDVIKPIEEAKARWDDLTESQNAQRDAAFKEIDVTKNLWGELQTLADADGNVDEANRIRAEYILGELNEAMGTEYDMVDGQIRKYNELSDAIKNTISLKQGQAILESGQDSYTEAVSNIQQTGLDKANASVAIDEQEKMISAKEKELYIKAAEMAKSMNVGEIATRQLTGEYFTFNKANNKDYQAMQSELKELKKNYDDIVAVEQDQLKTISKYSELQTAVYSNSFEEIDKLVATHNINIKTADNANLDELQDYIRQTGLHYADLLKQHKQGLNNVSQEQVDAAREMYESSQTEYQKAGGVIPDALQNGIDEKMPNLEKACDDLEKYLLNRFDDFDTLLNDRTANIERQITSAQGMSAALDSISASVQVATGAANITQIFNGNNVSRSDVFSATSNAWIARGMR